MPSVPTPRLPTVSDVAEAAGVSRQTVSNVLNAPAVVRPDTRGRVEKAIADLGYRPHASARRLRTRKSSTIGIRLDPVQNGISGAVLDRFLHAVTEQADRRGYRILLYTAASPADEIAQFGRLLDGADVDGFVLTSTSFDDPRTEWLIAAGAEFVTFGRPWGLDDVDDPRHRWVDVDGRHGIGSATRSLLDDGARRIAFVGWPAESGAGNDRRRGWREAMAAGSGLPSAALDALDLHLEDSVAVAAAAVRELLDAGELDAVVCASDTLALGASTVVGPRVRVVGYDDTPVAAALGFSSVQQPLEEVATAALELLLDGAAGADGRGGAVGAAGAAAGRHRLLRPRTVWR
ncbi:DNA-binding LacI/PurR family transcriptional regulator [Frigoribacterium sp. PvP120]|uniref:LacI family DNA-binding transcriptional regulator n=1 Tax=unclassified Frigoribacterium TaxID=2627005 RepID=UPI001B401043|nr:LacI family DNA-binding transcriptional regulator [Frigoribacterium sp. PvP121]MBP1240650.1 DNA-binding LacI/PurR family transcriptional regulator [Frigoribacterium sp. PvP121]